LGNRVFATKPEISESAQQPIAFGGKSALLQPSSVRCGCAQALGRSVSVIVRLSA